MQRSYAPFCARTTSLQNVVGVKSRGMSATFMGVLKRSAGTSDRYSRSCASPFSVTMPLCSNSASGRSPRAFSTILPRGILILNARSSRNTMSRKSIDSASRPSISDTFGSMSSTSQPSASAIVSATFGNTALISSCVTGISAIAAFSPLIELETAVDVEHLSRYVARVVRREEPHGMRDFLRRAETLHENPRLRFVAGHVADVARHLGVDHARRYRVDADLARRELHRERARERVHRALARRVVGLPAAALVAGHRAQVHDAPRALHHHVRHHGARDVEYAADVRVEHRRDVRIVEAGERVVADDSRVVPQNVDAPRAVCERLHSCGARGRIGDVDLHRMHVAPG